MILKCNETYPQTNYGKRMDLNKDKKLCINTELLAQF
jgi:hypothetical protein